MCLASKVYSRLVQDKMYCVYKICRWASLKEQQQAFSSANPMGNKQNTDFFKKNYFWL